MVTKRSHTLKQTGSVKVCVTFLLLPGIKGLKAFSSNFAKFFGTAILENIYKQQFLFLGIFRSIYSFVSSKKWLSEYWIVAFVLSYFRRISSFLMYSLLLMEAAVSRRSIEHLVWKLSQNFSETSAFEFFWCRCRPEILLKRNPSQTFPVNLTKF